LDEVASSKTPEYARVPPADHFPCPQLEYLMTKYIVNKRAARENVFAASRIALPMIADTYLV
jgi:hypothetical protein